MNEHEIIEWYRTLDKKEIGDGLEMVREMSNQFGSEVFREATEVYLAGLEEFRLRYGSRSPKVCEEKGLDYVTEISARVYWAVEQSREVVNARRRMQ